MPGPAVGSPIQCATERLNQLLPPPAQPSAPVRAGGGEQKAGDQQSLISAQSEGEN